MALLDQRATVLTIINEVERKLGLGLSASLTSRAMTLVLLRHLNETIGECCNYGDWRELYNEAVVSASTTALVTIAPSGKTVHHLHEIRFSTLPAAMIETDMSDMRRLTATSAAGTPRQWAFRSVDASANPVIQVWPRPQTAAGWYDVSFYEKIRAYTTDDADEVPPFTANLLIAGTYAKALFEEQSGEPSRQAVTQEASFQRLLREEYNRYNADSGTAFHFTPNRWRRGRSR